MADSEDPVDPAVAATVESTPDDDLGSAASLLRGLGHAPGAPRRTEGPLCAGQMVADKYRVVREIGEGGMGIVYLAHDTRLRRDVALKVGSVVSTSALALIEREGQALARLSHPNVVVVYEVGEVTGRVFVAMEHVSGGTARTWRTSKPRTWREVVALYAAAGDGLAAAHAAGIIHRDFKPDNVLVGDDGRPRVADFGLSLASNEHDDELATAGTPAYMPPEQRAGAAIDGRADQFAFATSMRQALVGTRPPRNVESALERAMAKTPAERWPSMPALLAELRRDAGRRRRTLVIAGLMTAGLGAAIILPRALREPAASPCTDGDPALATIWNDGRAAAIASAFSAIGGGPTWSTLRPMVDRYARDLATARTDACRATRIDGTQSDLMLDRRTLCLAKARSQLRAIVQGFATPDHTTVETARAALGLLPDLGGCADADALAKETPIPADPNARAAIERTFDEVSRVNASIVRGDEKDPDGVGDRLLAAARATNWPPLIASASRVRAKLLMAAHRETGTKAMEDAITLAMASGDDLTLAWSMAELAGELAMTRPADAPSWIDRARSIWTRRGKEPALDDQILIAEITHARTLGDGAAELALTRRRAELSQRVFGDEPLEVATRHHDLATAYERSVQLDEAEKEIQLAIAAAEKATGQNHPLVAAYLETRAEIEQRAGKLEPALEHARRALAIDEAWYGKEEHHLAYPLDTIGFVLASQGDLAGGREALHRELAILTAHDASSPQLANLETNLGNLESMSGHPAEALPFAERALAGHQKWVGADNPQLDADYILLGVVQRDLGNLAASEEALRTGLRIVVAKLGPAHPEVVNITVELAYTVGRAGRSKEAVALLEPMLTLSEQNTDVQRPYAAEVHTALADALWKAGGDHARARAIERHGRDDWAALGSDFSSQRAAADAWLAAHR